MRKQLIISITKRDIRNGRRRDECACPVALSLQRRYPGRRVTVNYEVAMVGSVAIPVTGKMETWMDAFDNRRRVKPTAFFVDVAV